MKKESKKHKALYSRFILLLIFTLMVGQGIFAQCTEVIPAGCAACNTNIDIDPACNATCYSVGGLTDLKNTAIAHPSATVTIAAIGFGSAIESMTITAIQVYTPACAVSGDFAGPYTSSTFPAKIPGTNTDINIVFQNFKDHVTISVPGGKTIPAGLVGYTLNFNVNVFSGGTTVTRNYFFKVVSTSYIVGDTHINTVDGVKYDFQAVGEFVTLKANGGDNLEIQTRQTAYAVNGPAPDSYDGITACVSVNTAVAARVGNKRVTFQPEIVNGNVDSTGMKLRVDGTVTQLGDNGIDLGNGGRIFRSSAGGGTIEIDFPNGASLIVTPTWVQSFHGFYLNITINNTSATKGLSGIIPYIDSTPVVGVAGGRRRSWLPALPDGSNVGVMPTDPHQRFITLYQTFADAWRITDATSLFDYASGTTTATFTNKNWPVEGAQSCSVPGQTIKTPIDQATAEQLTIGIVDTKLKANALFDVMVTGEPLFAQTYLLTQTVQTSSTAVGLKANKDTTNSGEAVTFTATVTRKFSAGTDQLNGTVEFTADGKSLGQVKVDASGHATFTTSSLEVGDHKIAARFTPDSGSKVFGSSSVDVTHIVTGGGGISGILHQWWFWLIVLLLLIIIIAAMRKKKKP